MTRRVHGNTGCDVLDAAGVLKGSPHSAGALICLYDCPYMYCVLSRNLPKILIETEPEETYHTREIHVQCEVCHTLETIELVNGKLGTHPRFELRDGGLYHLRYDGSTCGVCNGIKDRGVKV